MRQQAGWGTPVVVGDAGRATACSKSNPAALPGGAWARGLGWGGAEFQKKLQ